MTNTTGTLGGFTSAEKRDAAARLRLAAGRRWATRLVPGSFAAIVLFMLVAHTSHQLEPLIFWAAFTALASAALALVIHGQHGPAPTASGISRTSFVMAVLLGASWGMLPWIDLNATSVDDAARWFQVSMLLAFTAGVLAGLEASSRLAQLLVISIWTVAAVGFTATGADMIALASWAFIPAVSYVYQERQRALDMLVDLQVETTDGVRQAEWRSRHDPVTGKLNRIGLQARLEAEPPHPGWAMFIDLDHFKRVNDQHGHVTGDQVLGEAADRIERRVGEKGLMARIGGDEFLAIVRTPTEGEAISTAEAVIEELERPGGWGIPEPGPRRTSPISASIGITPFAASTFDMDRVVQEADSAMYTAKNSGRGRAVIYRAVEHGQEKDRLSMENELRSDLASGLLEAWGQPIVHLATGEVTHVELLARWRRSDGSVLAPETFLPFVKKAAMLPDLTDAMLEHAADVIRRFASHEWLRDAKLAVNISAEEFTQRDVASAFQTALARHEIPKGRIVIDLIDAVGLDSADTASVFGRLARLGVGTAIDDFGESTQSVAALIDVHASIVKLDRALVRGSRVDSDRRKAVIAALQMLGEGCGYSVVAEGVETVAEANVLYDAGVRYAQGFLFAEPKPIGELMQESTREAIAEFTSELPQRAARQRG